MIGKGIREKKHYKENDFHLLTVLKFLSEGREDLLPAQMFAKSLFVDSPMQCTQNGAPEWS